MENQEENYYIFPVVDDYSEIEYQELLIQLEMKILIGFH